MATKKAENPYKVKLTSAGYGSSTVSFDASPAISENRNVNYGSLEPLHAPGQIQVYKNTSSRNFQISDVRILSRTIEEADRNLEKLWLLRSWCMPRFGNSTTLDDNHRDARDQRRKDPRFNENPIEGRPDIDFGTELLGAPPPILYLSAYSKTVGGETRNTSTGSTNVWKIAQHINRVPVVIQQLTIPYPNDIDYITTSKGVPMPIIMNLDLALVETHSPNSYEGFNLDAYRQGKLQGF